MTDDATGANASSKSKWGSGGSMVSGWPGLIVTIVLISSALYAFSPRDYPQRTATVVHPDLLIINGLASEGSRYIAAGELGHIQIADSPDGPWRPAKLETKNRAMITDVKFVAPSVAIAVGHSGWILRSQDSGETWTEIQFNDESADPFLGIAGPFAGSEARKIFLLGSFGKFLESTDEGRSWQQGSLDVAVEAEPEPEPEPSVEEVADAADELVAAAEDVAEEEDDYDPFGGDDYDPFASFGEGPSSLLGSSHMYDMTQASDGSLFMVGERGLLARSRDGGESWTEQESIYSGSFYGVLPLGENSLLVYGMRGNAFVTNDLGKSWRQSYIPVTQGLYSAATGENGEIILVGASNSVLVSMDGGLAFEQVEARGQNGLTGLTPLGGNRWLTSGEGGVQIKEISARLLGLIFHNEVFATEGGQS